MGTQAYWLKTGYRWRGREQDGDYGPWTYAPRLADAREDFAVSEYDTAEVAQHNRRSEAFETIGRFVRRPGSLGGVGSTGKNVRLTR
jgi:hypothetical protein